MLVSIEGAAIASPIRHVTPEGTIDCVVFPHQGKFAVNALDRRGSVDKGPFITDIETRAEALALGLEYVRSVDPDHRCWDRGCGLAL
jgi:hypothetical protein